MPDQSRLLIQDQFYIKQNGFAERVVADNLSFSNEDSTDPFGIIVDSSGTIYISDPFQHTILRVIPSGITQLFAGTPGVSGNNGDSIVHGSEALFNSPSGLSIDATGNIYVADTGNNQIRRITPDRSVSLVAGDKYGVAGFRGGNALEQEENDHALFNQPRDVAVDASGNLFIADTLNHNVRFIRYGINTVNRVAGTGDAGDSLGIGPDSQLNEPWGLGIREGGDLIIADTKNFKLKRLNKNFHLLRYSGIGTKGFSLGVTGETEYLDIILMDINQSGFIYLIDHDESFGSRLIRVDQDGNASLVTTYPRATGLCGVGGISVNNSDRIYVLETPYFDKLYSSSSSSSSLGYSSSSSSGGYSSSSESSSSSSSSEGFSSNSSSSSFAFSSSSDSSSSSSSEGVSDSSSSSSSSSEGITSSSESSGSSSSSLGECEDSTVQIVGGDQVVFLSGHFSEWTLGETICLENGGSKYQGTVTLLQTPAVYLTMDIVIDGILTIGDPITICKGVCNSDSSSSISQSTHSSSESSSSSDSLSSQGYSSSSSLDDCETAKILVVGEFDIVFISGHASDWVQGGAICLFSGGMKYEGTITLISGKNIFITMNDSITGIINNCDIRVVCSGPCLDSSSSSEDIPSSSSSDGVSSSSSSSENVSESSSSF